jgi:hypothetical protein
MARIHGRNGIAYISVTNGAAASACAYLSDWTINMTVDKVEVTAMGDAQKTYVAGLPDAQGDFSGWYDDATSQTYISARDGLSRNFYLYPNITSDPYEYFFGTIFPDFSTAGGVGAAVSIKSTWNAASVIQRYTQFGGLNT